MATFKLLSPAFSHGEEIPIRHTCEGENVSPPLSWKDFPDITKSFVLLVVDPDAPDPKRPGKQWTHWCVFNIPHTVTHFPEAMKSYPEGSRIALNDFENANYGGPCPPIGRHRYFFKMYALSKKINLPGEPTRADVDKAMEGHIIARAELMGTYEKRRRQKVV